MGVYQFLISLGSAFLIFAAIEIVDDHFSILLDALHIGLKLQTLLVPI